MTGRSSRFSRDELIKRILPELPAGLQGPPDDPLRDLPRHVAGLRPVVRLAVRAALHGVPQFLDPQGLRPDPARVSPGGVVFADRDAYLKFSRPELGEAGESVIGYFSLFSNRMTMYDLTGLEAQGRGARRRRTAAQINQILAQPDALRTVATIVHEATHQIAFNCGLHARLSDCPLWFSEGIADVLRDARPQQRQGLERHRGGQPAAAGAVSTISGRPGRPTRWRRSSATTSGSAT